MNRSESTTDATTWYKDAIIYELHVRSFYDSNADGIGDFKGLIQKLDYLKDLGVTAIWLLPFYPSPLRDDGYDIANYYDINPDYGTLDDFKEFMMQAQKKGMKVITELVINHTSDQHEWFQKSREAEPGTYWRDFYVWSDKPDKYLEARIIFKDFESSNWSWDPVAKQYFWHRFYSHQPDLNFDNPVVQEKILEVMDFWMELGVDGMRLDAVPYLFEREGTSCENLTETHDFLKKLRKYLDSKYENRLILAEANQWPEDSVTYFGDGDECHMCFHFPLMPRLFMSLKMEDRYSIIDILKQTPEIPESCQWGNFLRNHDELTLEMVTDEERDYMYKSYASDPRARINLGIRRRLAPLLDNDRRQIELLNGLLFSLPGTPILYYGDEIGMGDNIYLGDRNGVRTPFQWSPDRNAGFSKADPHSLFFPVITTPEYHYETINGETQQNNPNSLLWWMKRVISLRKNYPALSRGELKFLYPENNKVLVFTTSYEGQTVLVVANLSRHVQPVELQMKEYDGYVPIELFSQKEFPAIGELPYFFTLNPYSFLWFELVEKGTLESRQHMVHDSRTMEVGEKPFAILEDENQRKPVERDIKNYIVKKRWFTTKDQKIDSCKIVDVLHLDDHSQHFVLLMVEISYHEAESEMYMIPVAFAHGHVAEEIRNHHQDKILKKSVKAENLEGDGLFYEAVINDDFVRSNLESILLKNPMKGLKGEVKPSAIVPIQEVWKKDIPQPRFLSGEQSNSSFLFGEKFFLKLFRKLQEGENPDLEIGRFLAKKEFANTAKTIGSLDYHLGKKTYTLALLQGHVPSEQGAWELFLDMALQFVDQALAKGFDHDKEIGSYSNFFELLNSPMTGRARDWMSHELQLAETLGQRTAELHLALASDSANPDFKPVALTPFAQRAVYQSFRNRVEKSLQALDNQVRDLEGETKKNAEQVLAMGDEIREQYGFLRGKNLNYKQIRLHGDYHLGQVLYTGSDFMIIDFEGEPKRSIGERRLKGSALKDVAGLLRSVNYVAHYLVKEQKVRDEDKKAASKLLKLWSDCVSAAIVKSYMDRLGTSAGLVPEDKDEQVQLLKAYMLEKALYEITYELSSRPDWLEIPIAGLMDLLPHRKEKKE